MVQRATTFASELIAVSITDSVLLPRFISISLAHLYCTTSNCYHRGDTRCGRHVKSTLDTTSYPQRESSGRDIYLTVLRNVIPSSVSRWNTVTELHYVVTRRKQWRVPRLFGLLTAQGATFDRRARRALGKRLSPYRWAPVTSILRKTGSHGKSSSTMPSSARGKVPFRQTSGTITSDLDIYRDEERERERILLSYCRSDYVILSYFPFDKRKETPRKFSQQASDSPSNSLWQPVRL